MSGSQAIGQSHLLRRLLAPGRPLVMGVLNLTPDSFSDGGRFVDPGVAIAHAQRMAAEGADILDVGAESTRPYVGAVPVPQDEELNRLAPVLPELVHLGLPVSIDSMKAEVAAWALRAGAAIVNDVWGLQRDPDMARVIAEHRVPAIIMHNRDSADPAIDIVADVTAFFTRSLEIAARAGIEREAIVLDPGVGFGKTPEQSMTVIARLDAFKSFGLPLLVGASRKRFINSVVPSPPDQRLGGSIAAHLLAVRNGASIVRVHDVSETVQALRVTAAIAGARRERIVRHEAVLALGGNVGDVRATLDQAVALVCDESVRLVARSSDYRTPPWGVTDQAPFVNCCLIVTTELSPHGLLDHVLAVERMLGRDRAREQRWGPRPVDIDIIAYDDVTVNEPSLTLPHPRALERAFVLVPLAEIAPDLTIAGTQVRDALARLDTGRIERLPPR